MADLIDQKSKGVLSNNLLNDETLKDALREVRFAAHRAFERSTSEKDREIAWYMLDAANRFHRCLILAASRGSAAAKQIDKELEAGFDVPFVGSRTVRNRSDDMPWSRAR